MAKDRIEIIYQDNNLLVINKPTGISVTADRSGKDDILMFLSKQCPDMDQLRLVHRLDKGTSGVLLLAKNIRTQSLLSSAFEKRLMKKCYLAITSGYLSRPEKTLKFPLSHSRKEPGRMCVDPKRGKPAITEYTLLADFGPVQLLKVVPFTGRTHQIRIHLSHVGLPLAIDPVYGSSRPIMLSDFKTDYRNKRGAIEKPLVNRLTLHAYSIEIPETETTQKRMFIAKPDKKFLACIKMLNKHSGIAEPFANQDNLNKILNAEPLK